jgi:hypothetical protein
MTAKGRGESEMKYPRITIFVLAAAMSTAALATGNHDDDNEEPFDEARLFFELNDTDGDLGIHGKIDGDEWKPLEIEDPHDRKILKIKVHGRLKRQGLTELFFESAEPAFDELYPEPLQEAVLDACQPARHWKH